MTEKTSTGIRLAIRAEGDVVNAYIAREGTMADPLWLSSISRQLAENHPEFYERWKALATDILAAAVKEIFGQEPTMTTRTAPEHERSGRA